MLKLFGDRFQEYLNTYFQGHIYPCELGPMFDLSIPNHSKRVRRAIRLELTLSDGTPITDESYKKEKLYQDSLQAHDVMTAHPDLLDTIRSTDGGPKEGRWTPEEETTLISERRNNTPYLRIRQNLPNRTIGALRDKSFRLRHKA